jgi:hypothetical protein
MPRTATRRRTAGNALRDLSERWIPMGMSRCHAAAPWGHGSAVVCRTPASVELLFEDRRLPHVHLTESEAGRLRIELRRPPSGASPEVLPGTLKAQASEGRVFLELNDDLRITLTL